MTVLVVCLEVMGGAAEGRWDEQGLQGKAGRDPMDAAAATRRREPARRGSRGAKPKEQPRRRCSSEDAEEGSGSARGWMARRARSSGRVVRDGIRLRLVVFFPRTALGPKRVISRDYTEDFADVFHQTSATGAHETPGEWKNTQQLCQKHPM